MLELCQGGTLQEPGRHLWTTSDVDYAAGYALLHEGDVWALTVNLRDRDILDLTGCGLDATAVAVTLTNVGLPAFSLEEDAQHPQSVLRRVSDEAIRAAGYRAVRLCEWIDWGHGVVPCVRHAASVCLVDLRAIVHREVRPLPPWNVHLLDRSLA
ncbi:MAG: hypothetical protein LC791_19265 [Acidobacteria bacterium]|nr:hypothetical protein [Acidobacteriota bacterium]